MNDAAILFFCGGPVSQHSPLTWLHPHGQTDQSAIRVDDQRARFFCEWCIAFELRSNQNRNLQENALSAALVRRVASFFVENRQT